MGPLTPRQQEDILTLCEHYENRVVDGVVSERQGDTAEALGWRDWRITKTVRLIKEHPELNIALAIKRGNGEPEVVFSTNARQLTAKPAILATRTDRSGFLEGILRVARYYAGLKVAYETQIDKRSATGRRTLHELRRQKAAIANLQASLDLENVEEAQIADFLDTIIG